MSTRFDDPGSHSRALFERARRVIPGGTSKANFHVRPHPFYLTEGRGCRVTDADGVEHRLLTRKSRVITPGGQRYVVVTITDITARVNAEQALKQSEERYRYLIEGSIQGILVHDDGRPLFVNHAFASIYGYDSPAEMLALGTLDVVIAPEDVDLMVKTHAIASMQPTHATSDMPWAEARLGPERIKGAYAWRTMLDHHIPLIGGSDFPVEEVGPLLGIYAAVTRQDAAGNPPGGWYPAQRMTFDEAIAAFTRDAAAAEHVTDRGVIAVGNHADLTVYGGKLAPDRSLLTMSIAMTVVDGDVVYERGAR